jgi:acetylornithine deacetylase/succinyl-diaminopimelate desuccinylase-like protein
MARPVARLLERLDALYEIGGGPGANRVGYSPEEDAAHALVADWLREAGFEVEVDAHRNLLGRLPGAEPELPEVWTGSHLDSVPQGGRYDGALGVLAGIEALERLGRRRRTLAVVAFREEERGCVGSRARSEAGGLPGAFVELHHEQGPRLAQAGAPLGVVTGIVGYKRGEHVLEGRAGHAGTTPMEGRADALVAAAAEILRVRDVATAIEGAVATVGYLEIEPGGVNVVPGRVRLVVDARAPDAERLTVLLRELGLDDEGRTEPVTMSDTVRGALRASVAARDLPVVELASGAGHDAGILAAAGVEAGMLFVRAGSGGISHHPDESAAEEDVALAVEVLTEAVDHLASA